MSAKYIIGDFIDGSSAIYKKGKSDLIKGLQFQDGEVKWFDDCYVGNFYWGLAIIDNWKRVSYINRKGEFVIPFKYMIGGDFSCERTVVADYEYVILIDTNGNEIKKYNKDFLISEFNQGYARKFEITEKPKNLIEVIDLNGETVLNTWCDTFENPYELIDEDDNFSEGVIRIKRNNYYGFVDLQGNVKISFVYDYASAFSNGISSVQRNDNAYYINKDNKKILDIEFEDAKNFSEGLAPVKQNNKWGMIDLSGNKLVPFEFDELSRVRNGEILFNNNNKWGMMNKEMKVILPAKYDSLNYFIDGISKFTIGYLQGVVDRRGNEILNKYIFNN